jgi:hypothetical protein
LQSAAVRSLVPMRSVYTLGCCAWGSSPFSMRHHRCPT